MEEEVAAHGDCFGRGGGGGTEVRKYTRDGCGGGGGGGARGGLCGGCGGRYVSSQIEPGL